MVCISRPYHFKIFKGCLPHILFGPFLNSLTHKTVPVDKFTIKVINKHTTFSTNNKYNWLTSNDVFMGFNYLLWACEANYSKTPYHFKVLKSCVFVLRSLLLPSRESRTWALRSESKIDQTDFTDWMYFLPSNLMKKTSPNSEALSTNT